MAAQPPETKDESASGGGRAAIARALSVATRAVVSWTSRIFGEMAEQGGQAVREFQAAVDAGRPPDRAAFVARHPAVADELADCLDGLCLLHDLAPTEAEEGAYAHTVARMTRMWSLGCDLPWRLY